jgi:hypothetical protein
MSTPITMAQKNKGCKNSHNAQITIMQKKLQFDKSHENRNKTKTQLQ